MSNFFSPEAEMALEDFGNLFPSSMCQSPPNMVYSPPPQHMPYRVGVSQPGAGSIYEQPDYRTVATSPYPPHSYWPSQPSIGAPAHASYSTYPPLSSNLASTPLSHEVSLIPRSMTGTRPSRSHSSSSVAHAERSPPLSRSMSPSSPDLRAYGYPNKNGTWSCAYPGCTSRAVFTRGCDLRKHHKRHTKSFFCRHEGCPQSTGGGFSSKKDLARHEAKHNPGVLCDWEGCDRVFSRVDNMVRTVIGCEVHRTIC
jgi:hypothetical protein